LALSQFCKEPGSAGHSAVVVIGLRIESLQAKSAGRGVGNAVGALVATKSRAKKETVELEKRAKKLEELEKRAKKLSKNHKTRRSSFSVRFSFS
jgi:hypothetical protein